MIVDLKPYPAMKDSGVPWLGQVPEHWDVRKLKYLVSFSGGGTPSKANASFWNGHIPWVSPKDMQNGRITDATDHITDAAVVASATSLLSPGAVIIVVRSGILRRTIPIAINEVEVALNQDMKALRPLPGLMSEYLRALVQGNEAKLIAEWTKQGATVESIEHEFLANARIPLPPLPEQHTIVRFLDHTNRRIERYIRAKRKLIALLNEQKQAIIHRAATRGLDPNVRLKPSGIPWLGDIPEPWRLVRAKQVSQVFIPQRDKPDVNEWEGIPWITLVNVGEIFTAKINLFVTQSALVSAGCRVLPAGSVVASCVGRFGIASVTEVPVIINQQLQAYIPSRVVSAKYVRYCVQVARPYFEAKGNSTTLAYVDRQGFGSMPLPLPSLKEQEAIEQFLETELAGTDRIILRAQREIALIREYETRLVADVVTGQVDVREAAAKLPEEIEELEPLDETGMLSEDEEDNGGSATDTFPDANEA